MTNAEKFRTMTDKEIVDYILWCGDGCGCCVYDDYTCANDCEFGIGKWLKLEASK